MLTHVTNFVIHVTKFVTNFFCADNENYLGHSEGRPLVIAAAMTG